jgi:hypothetical protein
MTNLLLILVLFADPSIDPVAQQLGKDLTARSGGAARVLVGPDALKELDAKGLRDADLIAAPKLGEHLTASDEKLVIIRLDSRDAGGDKLVECQVWSQGRLDRHAAIAGKGGDPTPGVITGVVQILGPMLSSAPIPSTGNGGADVAVLAQRQMWHELADKAQAQADKTPRDWYYLILARVRLNQIDAARADLATMAKLFPGHFQVSAAEGLLPVIQPADTTPTKPAPASDAKTAQPTPATTAPATTKPAAPTATPDKAASATEAH